MRTLIALAALVLVPAAVASPSPPPSSTHILSCLGKPLLRPEGTVVLACADANAELKATHWTSWTSSAATGTTDFGLNLCKPSCAASHIVFFPHSHVRLGDVKHTAHGAVFSRATITYTQHGKTHRYVAYPPTR